jgi:hypothetical protein
MTLHNLFSILSVPLSYSLPYLILFLAFLFFCQVLAVAEDGPADPSMASPSGDSVSASGTLPLLLYHLPFTMEI